VERLERASSFFHFREKGHTMQTELHIGFRWELTEEDIKVLEKKITESHGYEEIKVKKCVNGHTQEDGKFCKICGSELKTSLIQQRDTDFEWWLPFDENGFYNTGTTIYLSVDRGFVVLDADELCSLESPADELSELLNFFATPITCAFVLPGIYNYEEDE
jgi:hypothetical protein